MRMAAVWWKAELAQASNQQARNSAAGQMPKNRSILQAVPGRTKSHNEPNVA